MRASLVFLFTVLSAFPALAKETVFDFPRLNPNGAPIDYCLYPAKQCGQPAADAFCEKKNAGKALRFEAGRSYQQTYIMGTKEFCDAKKYGHCDSFKKIVCVYYTY
ncbi:MAG: hypothetical protein WBP94_09115 [Rhodomicrobiaceae bacterium]